MILAVGDIELTNAVSGDKSELVHINLLVERCREGETEAFDELYRFCFTRVYRWTCKLAGNGADVEDLCQDVFLVVFKNIGDFRGDARFTSWLYGITKNTVKYHFRKKRILDFFGIGKGELSDDSPSLHKSPLQSAEEREATDCLYSLLDKLPATQKEAFVLFELEEMSGEEISELLNVNINTVFARLFHARKKLRKIAEKQFAPDKL